MADTAIEWATKVWNPTTGCDRVSPGCDHCYALTMAKRLKGMGSAKYQRDGDPRTSGPGFAATYHSGALGEPFRWRKPQRCFVNSMSDLFHDAIPDVFIQRVWEVMWRNPQHTFMVLTKRHARMRSLLGARSFVGDIETWSGGAMPWPLPNVWLGVSAEDQRWADIRIPALLDTPAAVRFVSAEPLLGPIDLKLEHSWDPDELCGGCSGVIGIRHEPSCGHEPGPHWGIDWVISGGESGPGARPAHPQWFRSLRDQCQAVGVAYLHKQNGEWLEDFTHYPANPECGIDEPYRVLNIPRDAKDRRRCAMNLAGVTALQPGNEFNPFERGHPGWTVMRRVGKKVAGRELDGRTWNGYPDAVAAR